MKPSVPLTGGEMIPKEILKGDIEFNNVCFVYPTRKEQVR